MFSIMKKLKAFWQQQRRNPLPLLLVMTGIYLTLLMIYIMREKDEYKSNWYPVYSTYYKDETGVLGFFNLLNKTDIPAQRWQRPYRFLDSTKTHNIWVVSPTEQYRMHDSDFKHLAKCIEKGGNLVCIVDENIYNTGKLFKTFRIFKQKEKISFLASINKEKAEVLHPVSWFGHVDNLSFKNVEHKNNNNLNMPIEPRDYCYFYSDTFAIIPHIRIKGTQNAQIAMMHYGKGRVFLCSVVDMITNKGIQEKSNGLFWLNLAKNLHTINKAPILFDEYSHGFGNENTDTYEKWSPFQLPESKYVLWGMTLLFILYAHSMGKRIIKPVKAYEEPRRRVMEFVEAVANMYEKHKAHNAILDDIVQRFKKHLITYLHISQNSTIDEIVLTYQKKHGLENSQKLSDLLQRIERTKNKANLDETTAIIQEIRTFCLQHKIEYFKV